MVSHWCFWWDQLWAYNVFYLISVISWNPFKVFSSLPCSNGIANTWLATRCVVTLQSLSALFIYTRIYWISFNPIFVSLLSVDWLFWTEVLFYIHSYVCNIKGYGSPFFVSHVTEIRMAQKGQASTRCSIGKLLIAEDVIVMVYISLLVFGKIVLAMLRHICYK